MDARRLGAEALGTFWLVFGGCGSAVLAANFAPGTNLGIGLVGVSLAFGLTVLTGVYALGHISGAHFNPAVTIGLAAGGRFPTREVGPYVAAQLGGAIVAAAVLAAIATGADGFQLSDGFAANGFGDLSPGGYSLVAALVAEVVATAMFVAVIMGATARRAVAGAAGAAIGLCLTLVHLITIPVTNTSVNPARSTSQALFAGGDHLAQLWLFWLAPIVGAVIGALVYQRLDADAPTPAAAEPEPVA